MEDNILNGRLGSDSSVSDKENLLNHKSGMNTEFHSALLLDKDNSAPLFDISSEQINNLPKEDKIVINSDEILNMYQEALDDMEETRDMFDKYSFDWDYIDVVIGGKSSVDLSRLTVGNYTEAEVFLKLYGYDLGNDNINEEVKNIFKEAISFLENVLIPDPVTKEVNLVIPEEIKNETDIRNLLLISSDHSNRLQPWACSVLRVMHTISHVNNDISLKFFPEIQRQILDNLWSAISINSKGEKFLGDEEIGIKIYDINIKAKKERNSTILKLLHKIENVAADVFDQIGVRIITHDKVDALLIIRYLRKTGVLDFCNVKPSRSINKLIDVKVFKKILNYHKERLKAGEINKDEFERIIRQEAEKEANLAHENNMSVNPYTSTDYKSIQFTCRQMIRMKYPFDATDMSKGENFCFFFPYEMQIVDINTHTENSFGKASHEKYKEKQLISARRRILGKLIRNENEFTD